MSDSVSSLGLTNIPPLTAGGVLPPGIHLCTLEEIRQTFAHLGLHPRRPVLFEQLETFVKWVQELQFFPAIFVDGSFTTSKVAPNDIDVCLELPPVTPESKARLHSDNQILKVLDVAYCKHTYSVDVLYWRKDFPEHNPGGIGILQKFKPDNARALGLPENSRKGLLKVML